MIKNIILLTKISTINYINNMNIIDKNTNKINKKSIYFWMVTIIAITVSLLSNKVIGTLQTIGQGDNFLNIYFTFMFILMIFQSILICPNVFYFAKDKEILLQYPIKSIELFLSKFNTCVIILYTTEVLFMFFPMILYGINMHTSIWFYFMLLIVMVIFPIFVVAIISLINSFLVRFFKLIRNENVYQILVIMIIIAVICIVEYFFIIGVLNENGEFKSILDSINNITLYLNKTFIVVNPLIDLLKGEHIISSGLKLVWIYLISYMLCAYIGNRRYIRSIMSVTSYVKNKTDKLNLEIECKKNFITYMYIKNELRQLVRNMTFCIQYIFPVFTILIFATLMSIYFKINIVQKNQEFMNAFNSIKLNIEGYVIILVAFQILFSLINMSITAFSRSGRNNAIFVKYIPLNLYKQFWLKSILQIIISGVIAIITCCVLKFVIDTISVIYIVLIFIDALLLGILNSIVMLIVDLKRPFLNWTAEYEVIKLNSNKLFQYIYTIAIVLILMYLSNVFEAVNLNIAIMIITSLLLLLIIFVDRYVNSEIKKNKLFNEIS